MASPAPCGPAGIRTAARAYRAGIGSPLVADSAPSSSPTRLRPRAAAPLVAELGSPLFDLTCADDTLTPTHCSLRDDPHTESGWARLLVTARVILIGGRMRDLTLRPDFDRMIDFNVRRCLPFPRRACCAGTPWRGGASVNNRHPGGDVVPLSHHLCLLTNQWSARLPSTRAVRIPRPRGSHGHNVQPVPTLDRHRACASHEMLRPLADRQLGQDREVAALGRLAGARRGGVRERRSIPADG